MKSQKTSLRKRVAKNLTGIALGGMIALAPMSYATAGGLFGNYGELKADKAVTTYFENSKLKSDHKYFVARGEDQAPTAILGLYKGENENENEGYELGNKMLWDELDSKNLEKIVQEMKNSASENSVPIRGANVLDKNGNDVGDFYSTTTDTVIKSKNGKTFTIYAPSSNSGGGGAGGGCFLGGTKILMADGTSKNIRDIREGEKVMSYSFDTKTAVPDVVAEKYSVKRDEGLYNVNGVCVTQEHPFFEEADKLTTVSGLKQDQTVIGDSDTNPATLENIVIENITELEMPGEFEVFNMMTGDNHNYFVLDEKGNSFLVHNKGGGGR